MRTTTPSRNQQIADFYTRSHSQLRRVVASRASTTPATIDDACQTAWTTLLRRPDVTLDSRGLRWLIAVATHEAWRLASIERELPAGDFRQGDPAEPGVVPEPPADTPELADQITAREQHDQRLADLAQLKPREREALYLKGLGYSYQEIGTLTGATYTAVNRRITEGRAHLRKLENHRSTDDA